MVRIFRHYMPGSLLFVGVLEHLLLIVSIYAGLFLRWVELDDIGQPLISYFPKAITFATVISVTMFSLGLYNKSHVRSLSTVITRLLFSYLLGFVALALVFYLYPGVAIWRSAFALGLLFSIVGIMAFRWLYLRLADIAALKRRILVLGVGEKAARIEALERDNKGAGFTCLAFVPLSDTGHLIDKRQNLWGNLGLAERAGKEGVEEIVVAIDERRGNTPVDALLDCKLAGIEVTDFPTFWERETGKVDLDALHPSWLIFSDGFVGGWHQAVLKRCFDLTASVLMLVFTLPLMLVFALAIRLESRGPIFYRQERVGLNGKTFPLLKFRSMRVDAEQDGVPKWAAIDDHRVTRIGGFMRRSRIDELPQIFNVIKGDMSFIGPRPERPFFVETLREQIPYYLERHRIKPGISGWAQLNYPYGASAEDAKEKFQYDLYYIKNYSLFLDIIVLVQTARVILWPVGAR